MRRVDKPPGVNDYGWSLGYIVAELEHRIGYSHAMNWFDPTKAHAVPRSVAVRDEVYARQGFTGESIRVVGG
jgi:hypothetical protein